MANDDPRDLSPAAVARRLDEVGALYRLMMSLREIRVSDARPAEAPAATPEPR